MRSALFTRLLLIIALLFAQLGGLTHGISHALADQSENSDQSLPYDKHCDICEAYAQIGGAIGSSNISFVSSENCETLYFAYFSSYTSYTFVAFAARAPPHSA